MDNFPILTTERLLLRALTSDDIADLFAVHSDAEGMRWFGEDPMTNLSDAENLLKIFDNLWLTGTGLRGQYKDVQIRHFLEPVVCSNGTVVGVVVV